MTDALLGRGTYRSTAGYELSDEHHRLLYLGMTLDGHMVFECLRCHLVSLEPTHGPRWHRFVITDPLMMDRCPGPAPAEDVPWQE